MKVRLKEGEIKTIKEVIARFDPQVEIIERIKTCIGKGYKCSD